MMSPELYRVVSVAILALLLFFPVSRIIWVLSVRRLRRSRKQELDEGEIQQQRQRARVIGAIVSLMFSYLFNAQLLGDFNG